MAGYSQNKELRYGTEDHSKIREAIMARYYASREKMGEYYDDFDSAEIQQQAYIPETAADAKRRANWDDNGIMDYRTVVIPYDYATVLSAHTYWTTVFLSRNPVFQFMSRHGAPEMATQAVEALMDYQALVGRWLPALYIWLYDAASYPFGVLCNYWTEEYANIASIEDVPQTYLGMPVPGKFSRRKITRRAMTYQGNRLFNVRPYDFYPDHRVPIVRCHEGEYCGRKFELGWNTLVKGRETGTYYNLDAVKRVVSKQRMDDNAIGLKDLPGSDWQQSVETADIPDVGTIQGLEFYVELIPRDWKLGSSRSPEVWRFTLAEEQVVIESRPCGNMHQRFPYFVLPYDFEGHAFMGRSMYGLIQPMTDVLNWLINTHMFNVRSVLNNKLVADPSRVVMKDLLAGDSRVIRLRPEAYGTDPRLAVSQLTVGDVTATHMRDAQSFMEMTQRVTGVVDNIMGMVNAGGRKTATEIRSSSSLGINRLKNVAEWWSAVGFTPLAQAALANTQQYYNMTQELKIVGDLVPGPQTLQVSPESILGEFDFVPVDGTMPIDRYAQANLWREILAGMYQMPNIMQQYDTAGIFAWMAQLAGLKNIKQFKINIMPQEQVQQNVARGNLVPIPGGRGPGGVPGATPGGAPPDLRAVSEPMQISGMGPTG
jgi:hypothetical protein